MGVSRQFVDSFGFSWQALEITRDDGEPDRWLYFLARGSTRRLRVFPSDWSAGTWADLEELCTRAEVVGTDRGSRPVRALSERPRTASAG
jgi:hypothetical protein